MGHLQRERWFQKFEWADWYLLTSVGRERKEKREGKKKEVEGTWEDVIVIVEVENTEEEKQV